MTDRPPPKLRAHIWSGHFTNQKGTPDQCRAAVHNGGRWPGFHQCTRKPVVFRELDDPAGTFGFCKIHDPVAMAEKRRIKEARWKREWDERSAAIKTRQDRAKAIDGCVLALREIEAGHNDPRALARQCLSILDAIK